MSRNRTIFDICSDGYGVLKEGFYKIDLQSYYKDNGEEIIFNKKRKYTWKTTKKELDKVLNYTSATFAKVQTIFITPSYRYYFPNKIYIFDKENCPKELLEGKYTLVE